MKKKGKMAACLILLVLLLAVLVVLTKKNGFEIVTHYCEEEWHCFECR